MTKLYFEMTSEKDLAMMAMGSASITSPPTMVTAPIMRTTAVTGTTSPYPTVVSVATAHHMASGMEPSLSGWTVRSTRYMTVAASSTPVPRMTRQASRAYRSRFTAR